MVKKKSSDIKTWLYKENKHAELKSKLMCYEYL